MGLSYMGHLKEAPQQYLHIDRVNMFGPHGTVFFARLPEGKCIQFVHTRRGASGTIHHYESEMPIEAFEALMATAREGGILERKDLEQPRTSLHSEDWFAVRLGPRPENENSFHIPGILGASPEHDALLDHLRTLEYYRILAQDLRG